MSWHAAAVGRCLFPTRIGLLRTCVTGRLLSQFRFYYSKVSWLDCDLLVAGLAFVMSIKLSYVEHG